MKLSLAVGLPGVVVLSGCSSSTRPARDSQGEIRIFLADQPAEYDAVNIVATEVSVNSSDADSASGWIVLNDTTRTYDLLTLSNGASQILVSGTISGTIDPASSGAAVFTMVGANTVSTFADTATGALRLVALPANTSAVHVVPMVLTFRDTTLTGVPLAAGQDAGLGTITLSLR
jgi:hypothetical protein